MTATTRNEPAGIDVVQLDHTLADGRRVDVTVQLQQHSVMHVSCGVRPPSEPEIIFGWSTNSPLRQAHEDLIPGSRLLRVFGGSAGWSRCVSQLRAAPASLLDRPGFVAHCSSDLLDLPGLNALLDYAEERDIRLMLTPVHEVHNQEGWAEQPAEYRELLGLVAEGVAVHSSVDRVIGQGPALTRWWLVNRLGDAAMYFYDDDYRPANATLFFDCYDEKAGDYRDPTEMLARYREWLNVLNCYGGLAEWGSEREASDENGDERAEQMAGVVAILKNHNTTAPASQQIRTAGWWCIGGCHADEGPELEYLRSLMVTV
jgi:hypothetical protein